MSSIPPNFVGPILQSGVQQQHSARQLASEQDQQAGLISRAERRSEQDADTIGDAGTEMQVSAESEGGGSQGRAFQGQGEGPQPGSPDSTAQGIQKGSDGQLHVDLEA